MDDLPVRGHPARRYRPAVCDFESTRRMRTAESEELGRERRSCLDDGKSKDVLPGLSQSRKKPMRRRMESSRRQLLRLTHESLESRQLLTVVTHGDFDADGLFTTADLTLALQGGMAERKDEG